MNPRYPLVAERAAHQCEYCPVPEAVFNFPFEIKHVIPPNRGGPNDKTNWALSCRSCNLHKSALMTRVERRRPPDGPESTQRRQGAKTQRRSVATSSP